MAERLKQIWAGFEDMTSRHLTGRGVENIVVPHRVDYAQQDEAFLPADFHGPAETAFEALRETLAAQEKRFGRQRASETPSPPEETLLSAPAMNGDDLVKGLRATALRTERAEYDYSAFLNSDEGRRAVKKYKKKKRFGLF